MWWGKGRGCGFVLRRCTAASLDQTLDAIAHCHSFHWCGILNPQVSKLQTLFKPILTEQNLDSGFQLSPDLKCTCCVSNQPASLQSRRQDLSTSEFVTRSTRWHVQDVDWGEARGRGCHGQWSIFSLRPHLDFSILLWKPRGAESVQLLAAMKYFGIRR